MNECRTLNIYLYICDRVEKKNARHLFPSLPLNSPSPLVQKAMMESSNVALQEITKSLQVRVFHAKLGRLGDGGQAHARRVN